MKFFFVIRAGWDDNPYWMTQAEQRLMAKLCMKYEDNFLSSLKRMGFVSKTFSQTKVRRLRELNSALAKRTGCKITVKNLDDKKGRRNLAYFDVNTMLVRDKKCVQDDAKALCVKEIKNMCGEGVNLYAHEGKTLNANCWEHAKKLFQEDPDYSAVICSSNNEVKKSTSNADMVDNEMANRSKKKRKKKRTENENKTEANTSEEVLLMATVPFSCKTVEDAVLFHVNKIKERWEEDGRDTVTPEPMSKVEQIAMRLHNDKEIDDFSDDAKNSNLLDVHDVESNKGNDLASNDGTSSLLEPGQPQEQPPPSNKAMKAMESFMDKVTKEKQKEKEKEESEIINKVFIVSITLFVILQCHLNAFYLLCTQEKTKMKRKRVTKTSKTVPTVVNPSKKKEQSEDEEPNYKVESFVKVKRSKKKDSGGFLFLIKWIGYPDSENTWEPMSLLDDWDVEREQIYKFFEDENIDVSGCAKFDFVKREFNNDLKERVGDGLSDYGRLRAEKMRLNKAYLAKLGLDNYNNTPASSALLVNTETTKNNSDGETKHWDETTENSDSDDETTLNSDEVETTENATDDNEKKGDDKKKEKQDYARQFAIKKNYICDAMHDVENLKQETDGKYAKEPYFLHKKNCQICKVVFVYKEDEAMEKEKQFRVSTTNPCYICQSNTFCTYYMCGRCYNAKIVSGGKSKRVRV